MKDNNSGFLFLLLSLLFFSPKPKILGISVFSESVFPFGFKMKVKFSILLSLVNSNISSDIYPSLSERIKSFNSEVFFFYFLLSKHLYVADLIFSKQSSDICV